MVHSNNFIFYTKFFDSTTIGTSFTGLYVIVFILATIADLFYGAFCRLGSRCLFSIGSSDKCSFFKHHLRKTQQEDWNQGKSMILMFITTDSFLSQARTVSATSIRCMDVLRLIRMVIHQFPLISGFFSHFIFHLFNEGVGEGVSKHHKAQTAKTRYT